jgi:hypothetical protein
LYDKIVNEKLQKLFIEIRINMGKLFKAQVRRKDMSGVNSSMFEYYAIRSDNVEDALKALKEKYIVSDEDCVFEKIDPVAQFLVDLSKKENGSVHLYSVEIK